MERNIKTQAVVIRSLKKDSGAKFVTLFSRDLGLIRATLYGSAGKKSASKASQFSYGEFLLYHNPVKGSYTISEENCAFIAENIKRDLSATYTASYFAEVIEIFKTDDYEQTYSLLTASLKALDTNVGSYRKVLIDFTWCLLKNNGVSADLRYCPNCDRALSRDEVLHYSSSLSSPVCQDCADTDAIVLLPGARRYLIYTLQMSFEEAQTVELYSSGAGVISSFLLNWVKTISPYPIKSLQAGVI